MHELIIEGVIGDSLWGGVSSAAVRDELAGLSGDVKVYLNSIGGDVTEGTAIYSQLRRHNGRVSVVVEGIAASIASVIAQAGAEVIMSAGSQMMIHDPWTVTLGDEAEHQKAINALRSSRDSILDIYTGRVPDRETVSQWMLEETWFTAARAVEAGLADSMVDDSPAKTAAESSLVPRNLYRHTPAALLVPANEPAPTPDQRLWKAIAMERRVAVARRR